MSRRLLFHLGPTGVYLQPIALLLAAGMLLLGYGDLLWVSLVSILLHEGAHAAVSACFGKPPQDIEITPLGALMRLEDDEALPTFKRLLTLLAGPAMTLLLCFLALQLTARGWLSIDTGRLLFINNVSMLLVNLLPALPLDGGRMLALLLSRFLRPGQISRLMRGIGTGLGLMCIGANLWVSWRYGGWNLSLASVGCFLMYSASTGTVTRAMAELRHMVDRKIRLDHRGYIHCTWIAVTEKIPLQRAMKLLHPTRYTMFCVAEQGTGRWLGNLSEQTIMAAAMHHPSGILAEAMEPFAGNVETTRKRY